MLLKIKIISIINNYSKEMKPVNTGLKADTRALKGIKAVLFDLYGTLFISEAGDISHADTSGSRNRKKIKKQEVFSKRHFKVPALILRILTQRYIRNFMIYNISEIKKRTQKNLKNNGIQYPEVVITEIWERIMKSLTDKKFQRR